jgi:hypothetical protein
MDDALLMVGCDCRHGSPSRIAVLDGMLSMLLCFMAVSCRQKMTSEKLTMDDGLMMRTLADSPGGLELHIGVRAAAGKWALQRNSTGPAAQQLALQLNSWRCSSSVSRPTTCTCCHWK